MSIQPATLATLQQIQTSIGASDDALKAILDPMQVVLDATPPSQAVAHGLTKLLFQSGPFADLSRIDINNTNTSTTSTDWWVANSYIGQPGENPAYGLISNIPASALSVNSGILRIAQARPGAYYQNNQPTLSSNWFPGSLGNASAANIAVLRANNHGRFFRPPWYIDFQFTFDQRLARGGAGFPAFWGVDWWNGILGTEIDFMEFFPQTRFAGLSVEAGQNGSIGFNCGDFSKGVTTYPPLQNGQFPQPTFADLGNPKFDGTDLHTVGHLLIDTVTGGGTGFMERYFDDKEFVPNRLTYSRTAPPSYPPGAPAGTFSSCENVTNTPDYLGYSLYITCGNQPGGGDWPLSVRRIRVFGPDDSTMVVV
jgi:hypothetical protein